MHPSTEAILRYFECDHLPVHLQEIARPFRNMAHDCAGRLDGPELTAGLRKLLEAKDCMVRAALPGQMPARSGPRDFSAEVHSNITGKGPS